MSATLAALRGAPAGEDEDVGSHEERLRKLEIAWAEHVARCDERQKRMDAKLNMIIAGLGIVLTALVTGNPVAGLIARAVGGH